MPRILVTNDDGITSPGLLALASAVADLGEVVVVAPDGEYSGASAAIGPLHLIHPEVREARVEGVGEAWAVAGPPALCVYFARVGAFGERPWDLVVSGINPGANVGRSVQHSGTVGAAITAVGGGIPAVAVSQVVADEVEGQAGEEDLVGQLWSTAATVGAAAARALLEEHATPALALNVNVPNLPLERIAGWRRTVLAPAPRRAVAEAKLLPVEGAPGTYRVRMSWGEEEHLAEDTDGGALSRDLVSVSVLTRMVAADPDRPSPADAALDRLLGDR